MLEIQKIGLGPHLYLLSGRRNANVLGNIKLKHNMIQMMCQTRKIRAVNPDLTSSNRLKFTKWEGLAFLFVA